MQASDDVRLFSPFVSNEADPLWPFSDGTFHRVCLQKDEHGELAIAMSSEVNSSRTDHRRAGGRTYFTTAVVTSARTDPLFAYNNLRIDPASLPVASEGERAVAVRFLDLLVTALAEGRVKGLGLDRLVRELTDALDKK